MFSLVITVIAISLVAILAVATLYFGGKAFHQGGDAATAARLIVQSQQVMAAADLFKFERGRWPQSMQELVEARYLSGKPVVPQMAQREPGGAERAFYALVGAGSAHAGAGERGTRWVEVAAGAPAYWATHSVSEAVCREVNRKARGDNGIFNRAQAGVLTQCFGTGAPYTVLAHRVDSNDASLEQVVASAGEPALGAAPGGGGWAVPPNSSVVEAPRDEVEPVPDMRVEFSLSQDGFIGTLGATAVEGGSLERILQTDSVMVEGQRKGYLYGRWSPRGAQSVSTRGYFRTVNDRCNFGDMEVCPPPPLGAEGELHLFTSGTGLSFKLPNQGTSEQRWCVGLRVNPEPATFQRPVAWPLKITPGACG